MDWLATLALIANFLFPSYSAGSQGIQQLQFWKSGGSTIQLASTTAPIRIPFLANCDTIDTDADGVFSCGTDGGGGGGGGAESEWRQRGGASPFLQPTTTIGTIVSASSTFTRGLNITGNATTTSLTIGGWPIATSTATVCNSILYCPYQTIQQAVNAGWDDIYVKDGTYTLSSEIVLNSDTIRIDGAGDTTIISFPGSSVPVAFRSGGIIRNSVMLSNMRIVSSDVGEGVGVDLGKFKHVRLENLTIDDVNICVQATTTSTFYNNFTNIRCSPEGGDATPQSNVCFLFSNSGNKNEIHDGRCFPSTTASTTGIVADAAGLFIQGIDVSDAAIGIDVQDDGHNTHIQDAWLESNYTAIKLASGVKSVFVDGATHIQASPSHASTAIDDQGAIGFCIQAHVDGDPRFGCSGTNTKFGFGTTTPAHKLDLYEASTKAVLRIDGGGTAEVQSMLQFDTDATIRGSGLRNFDRQAGSAWCYGNLYNSSSAWGVNYDTTALEANTDCFNPAGSGVTNYLKIDSAGLLTAQNATTTRLSTSYASSTLYFGAGLATCESGNMLTWAAGRFGCEADDAGAGGTGSNWNVVGGTSFLTPSTTIGIIVNASSTFNGLLNFRFGSTTAISATHASSTFANIGTLTLGTPLPVSSGGTGVSTFGGTDHVLYTTGAGVLASENALAYNQSTNVLSSDNASISQNLELNGAGVRLSAGAGILTMLGIGTGSDESLTINLNDTSNTVTFGSGSGVTNIDWSSITKSTFLAASSTYFSTVSASSTFYFGAGLADCHTGNMLTWQSGRFGCEDDTEGAGGGSANSKWATSTDHSLAPNDSDRSIVIGRADQLGQDCLLCLFATSTGPILFASTTEADFVSFVDSVGASMFTLSANGTGSFSGDLNVTGDISLETTTLSDDGDGALTFASTAGGSDEDLTVNLDDTANTAVWSSSTGVTTLDWGAFNLYTTGDIAIASTTPFMALSLGSGFGSSTKAILVAEHRMATSTAMTIDWKNGNTQTIRHGTSATTITFTNYTDGAQLKLLVCNNGNTAGAITFATQVLWPGGVMPSQTTTRDKCDVWSFIGTQATSSLKIFGALTPNY